MKINLDIDCTPEEARRFFGLPDLGPLHDSYLDQMKTAISKGVTPEMVEAMIRNWSSLGGAGMGVWRQMFENMSGTSDTK